MRHSIPLLLLIISLMGASACGDRNESSSDRPATNTVPVTPTRPAEPEVSQETFNVVFEDLNPQRYTVKGTGTIIKDRDDLQVNMNMTKVPRNRRITQRIFNGKCPTAADDANGDGYLDFAETSETLGQPIIGLDKNINTTTGGRGVFPLSSSLGKYDYRASGLVSRIVVDIQSVGADEGLDLGNSVVVIQGLPTFYRLPATVAGLEGESALETLPLACGKVEAVIFKELVTE
ncbi:MAG TPA: hypothetical protein VNJ01_07145 [Bacteriovoracaceae bacterium]|nr:hypothetical protein [Bacteriovoracaceae bacterium]